MANPNLVRRVSDSPNGSAGEVSYSSILDIANKNKNFLINSNFDFWQRNITFSTSGYTADRWRASISGTATITQNALAVPSGSLYTARYTSGGGASFTLFQALESNLVKSIKGKLVTAAVKIKRNSTYDANFTLSIDRNGTADTSTGGTWTTISSVTLTAANIAITDYMTVSVSATIPGDATANGIRVFMGHTGSATSGSVLDMSQVSLVIGDDLPSEFSTAGSSYIQELELCQRYYEKSYALDVPPGSAQGQPALVSSSFNAQGTVAESTIGMCIPYTVRKRAIPTFAIYNPQTGTANQALRTSDNLQTVTFSVSLVGHTCAWCNGTATVAQGNTYGVAWSCDAEL